MTAELIINVTSLETRIALLENGNLAELHIERGTDKGIVGNIYRGKVQRVLPGMQAAFVDIGLPRAAFLCADDVYSTDKEIEPFLNIFKDEQTGLDLSRHEPEKPPHLPPPPIEDILTEGKEILVQVIKDPIGSKGARISSHISLPGRYLVFLPALNTIGISRRIIDTDERSRLSDIIEKIKPDNDGFIIRTASENASEEELAMDMEFLIKLWETLQKRTGSAPVPGFIHEELSISLRAIRDLYSRNVKKVTVDSRTAHKNILEFVDTFSPQLKFCVELYEGEDPIFDAYGIELEISRALGKRIWLKSGGYIVIEETEALVAIDVNTGKYVGKGNQDDTIFKTNLEALKEIAYQIRLRNLGGIIIIDFIDMARKSDRETILDAIKDALDKDRTKTHVLGMSELGLVQMTRKRVRENLSGLMCDPCPYCEGRGLIKSLQTICYDIVRGIKREASSTAADRICVMAHPDIVSFLYDEERYDIELLEKTINKKIIIKASGTFHHEKFEIYSQ